MKDYDIKIKRSREIELFGTQDDTIVVPSDSKLDSDRNRVDMDIYEASKCRIGIPEDAEDVELNFTDAALKLSNISFKKLQIDAKGKILIELQDVTGPIDINMVGGQAELILSPSMAFKVVCEGKNNSILCDEEQSEDTVNVIELNGKDSTLIIRR